LGEGADSLGARCWVGLLAEGLRDPALMARIRRHLEGEISLLEGKSQLSTAECSAILAYILGCLVFGAYAPVKTRGFALPRGLKMLRTLEGAR
jgi:hypothetical protein